MKIAQSVAEVLEEHVVPEVEGKKQSDSASF